MSGLYTSRAKAEAAAAKIRVFAQPLRLMIMSCLLDGERAVGAIEAATRIGQPGLSQQLAELRRAGLVQTRRNAKMVYYRLADETATACVRTIEAAFGDGRSPTEAPARDPSASRPLSAASAAVFATLK